MARDYQFWTASEYALLRELRDQNPDITDRALAQLFVKKTKGPTRSVRATAEQIHGSDASKTVLRADTRRANNEQPGPRGLRKRLNPVNYSEEDDEQENAAATAYRAQDEMDYANEEPQQHSGVNTPAGRASMSERAPSPAFTATSSTSTFTHSVTPDKVIDDRRTEIRMQNKLVQMQGKLADYEADLIAGGLLQPPTNA